MPEDRHFGRRDKIIGERWVYVSRAAAHAHPKGHLHWSFWLIALWLIWVAVTKFRFGFESGGTVLGFAMAFLPAFTAVLVLLRAPIARILLIALGIFTIYVTVKSGALGSGMRVLIDMLVTVTVTIWMWEGERPNLAYGYRFRSRGGSDD